MTKVLVFDMDGTLANFYGVDGWLNDLQNENPRPYEIAEPLYNMEVLTAILNKVREAKKAWLNKYDFPFDEIHLVKYGTTKANCTRRHGGYQILVDDNEKIRNGWNLGGTINANENIISQLREIA